MRNRTSLKSSLKLALLIAIAAVTTAGTFQSAQAQPATGGGNQWTIKVQTEQLKQQFVYNGSNMSPVSKLTVKIKKTSDNQEPKLFESVWCHDGNPVGLERSAPYLVKLGDLTHIEVEQKEYTEDENKAVAFVLMRLGLAAYHHFNPIIAMTLPERSFDSIVSELRKRKCEDFKADPFKSYANGVMFNLESEPAGKVQRLIYKTNSK